MPRIRTIKPEHWGDKNLPKISLGAHLLWLGMWNFSDDKGIVENDPHLLKSNIFPRRKEIKAINITKWVKELIEYKFVLPFEYDDIQYVIHRTFDIHQKIDKPQKSKIPEDVIRRTFYERLGIDIVTTSEASSLERSGEERESSSTGEEEEPPTPALVRKISLDGFPQFPLPTDLNGLPETQIGMAVQYAKITKQCDLTDEQVLGMWNIFKNATLTGKKYYKDKADVYSHFFNWVKLQKFENGKPRFGKNATDRDIAERDERRQKRNESLERLRQSGGGSV